MFNNRGWSEEHVDKYAPDSLSLTEELEKITGRKNVLVEQGKVVSVEGVKLGNNPKTDTFITEIASQYDSTLTDDGLEVTKK